MAVIWPIDFLAQVSTLSNKVFQLITFGIDHKVFSFDLKFRPVPRIKLVKKGIHATLGKTTGNINRLVIDSFSRDDAGKYKCRASDKSGQSDTKTTVIRMEGINLLCV